MNEDKLMRLSKDLEAAKVVFQESYQELIDIVHAIENEVYGVKEMTVEETNESVQNRLNDTLNKNALVSQLRDQINKPVAVVEPSEEEVNESYETELSSTSLTERLRSQLNTEAVEEAAAVSLTDQLRSQLDDSERPDEPYDEEDYDEEEEEEDYDEEEVTPEEESLSPLAQTLRNQMVTPSTSEDDLPDIDDDLVDLPVPSADSPNLADVLREQMASTTEQLRKQMSAPAAEVTVAHAVRPSSLTMEQMIQQLRNDINNTPDTEDEKKEEELVVATAASSNNDVAASLRQQLLTQELKKQLK